MAPGNAILCCVVLWFVWVWEGLFQVRKEGMCTSLTHFVFFGLPHGHGDMVCLASFNLPIQGVGLDLVAPRLDVIKYVPVHMNKVEVVVVLWARDFSDFVSIGCSFIRESLATFTFGSMSLHAFAQRFFFWNMLFSPLVTALYRHLPN